MATKTDTDAELREQVDALRADLEKLTQLFLRSGSEHADRIGQGAREAGSRALDEAMNSVESGVAYGERQVEGAEQWIRRNPFVAVLSALGAGFLLARLRGRD